MGSSLTIINQEQQKKLYKNLEGKWVIELDSEKIKNINDFLYSNNGWNWYYIWL